MERVSESPKTPAKCTDILPRFSFLEEQIQQVWGRVQVYTFLSSFPGDSDALNYFH